MLQKTTVAQTNSRRRVRKEKIKINYHSTKALLDTPTIFPLLSEYVLHTKHFTSFTSYLPSPDESPTI
ncbi:hypothetical protein CROQUDRAFT_100748 [Cronartium quercuum f. sp. fusiforme G11]|uniref:Uncharacterized protein n=1 Tax=Cronartium quercuum f. sp. fusiforme G11 TaxID=708437 RepID=A0A9P6N5X8_9BASI|nr:hypothetical protein CROQUDRAFT_100748 [Cronartium quercuum f. sp. fusiforme G11]